MAASKLERMCRIISVMVMTLLLFAAQIVVGHLNGSTILVADSFLLLTDLVASAVGLAAVIISKRDSRSLKNTFDRVRAEVLGALVNAIFLVALSFAILMDSLQRLIAAEPLEDPVLLANAGAGCLVVNLLSLIICYDRTRPRETRSLFPRKFSRLLDLTLQQEEGIELLALRKVTTDSVGSGSGSCSRFSEGDREVDYTDHGINEPQRESAQPAVSHLTGINEPQRESAQPAVSHLTGINEQQRESAQPAVSHFPGRTSSRECESPRSSSHLNMRGIFLHVMGHALGSAVTVISAMLVRLVPDSIGEGRIDWKLYIDPALSLVVVVIIVATVMPLLKETFLIVLQTVPTHLCIHKVKDDLSKIDGVLDVHELHVWQLTGSSHVATLHLTIANMADFLRISARVKSYFSDRGVHFLTIQPEFSELHVKKPGRSCALECGPEKPCHEHTCCGKRSQPAEPGSTTGAS